MARAGLDDDRELRAARQRAQLLDAELQATALALLHGIERELRRETPRPRALRRLLARLEELIGQVEISVDGATSQALDWAAAGILAVYLAGAGADLATAGARIASQAHAEALRRSLVRAADAVDRTTGQALRALSASLSAAAQLDERGRRDLVRRSRRVLLGRVGRVRYSDGSMHPFGSYLDMLLDTRSTLAYNQGTIDKARRDRVGVLQIVDGAGCGLTAHRDPVKADGLLVTLRTAGAYPIAHPKCVREFLPRPDARVVEAI